MLVYKEFATKAIAEDQRKAVDKALGLPRKGVNRGSGPHAPVPAVYAPGAIGWTATECAIEEEPVTKTALLAITESAFSIGKVDVVIDGGKLVTVDMTKDIVVEKPVKYDPKTEAQTSEPVKVPK